MVVQIRWQKPDRWIVPLRVTPKGGKDSLLPLLAEDSQLKLKVSAAPEKGEANESVIELIAEALDLPKSRVEIIKGAKARQKQVRIEAAWSQEECLHRFAKALSVSPEYFEILS